VSVGMSLVFNLPSRFGRIPWFYAVTKQPQMHLMSEVVAKVVALKAVLRLDRLRRGGCATSCATDIEPVFDSARTFERLALDNFPEGLGNTIAVARTTNRLHSAVCQGGDLPQT